MIDEKAFPREVIEAAEIELSRVLKRFDYCMPADGMARVLNAAYDAARPKGEVVHDPSCALWADEPADCDCSLAIPSPAIGDTGVTADGWQDISTAPKDGDVLLATDARIDGGHPQVVYRDTSANNGWHSSDGDRRYHPDAFTHWRRDCLASPEALKGE